MVAWVVNAGRGHVSRSVRGAADDRRADTLRVILLADTLAGLHAQLPSGMGWSDRQPADPPEVLEIWFLPIQAQREQRMADRRYTLQRRHSCAYAELDHQRQQRYQQTPQW